MATRLLKSRVIADAAFPFNADATGLDKRGATPEIPHRHQMGAIEEAGHVGPEPGRDGGLLEQVLESPLVGLIREATTQTPSAEADLQTGGPGGTRVLPGPHPIQEAEASQPRRQGQLPFPPPQRLFPRDRG